MTTVTGTGMYACPYCGFTPAHLPEQCHMVKAIEYFQNGQIKRIEKRETDYSFLPNLQVGSKP
jgi:hypothetical protein